MAFPIPTMCSIIPIQMDRHCLLSISMLILYPFIIPGAFEVNAFPNTLQIVNLLVHLLVHCHPGNQTECNILRITPSMLLLLTPHLITLCIHIPLHHLMEVMVVLEVEVVLDHLIMRDLIDITINIIIVVLQRIIIPLCSLTTTPKIGCYFRN